jgi:6-phosphogluconolactonase
MSAAGTVFAAVSCADDGSIHVLALHGDGRLEPVQRVHVGGRTMPLACGPGRRTLYVARRSEPYAVVALSIDAGSGRLAPLGEAPLPDSMAYLEVDRTGRWLLAASYPGHLVSVSAIGADAVPRPAHQVLPGVPNAHCVRLTPDDRFAFVVSLGADEVRSYRFDAMAGRLEPLAAPAARLSPGAGPRHLVFNGRLDVAYLLDELDGQVHVFDVDFEAGALALRQSIGSLPDPRPDPVWCADVRITPDGRFLYSSERTSSILTGFKVDPADGTLAPIGHWATQRQPRALAVDPRGRFLLAAGQASHRVGVHAIGTDGRLTEVGEVPVGPDPNWIAFIAG